MSDEPRVIRQWRFQPPPGSTEILIVRHGESEAAVAGEPFELVEGQGDPPLSSLGREEATLFLSNNREESARNLIKR